MEKIQFKNGQAPYIDDTNLNQLQSNVEQAIDEKSSLPVGGTTGQVLAKASNENNDIEWIDQTGGSGGTATGDTLPIGSIISYSSNTVPTNWLLCDGAAISRTEYSELFNVIGTINGEGDGETTFNLPDLRDKFILGAGLNYNVGDTGGEKEHQLTIEEMPSHNHEGPGKFDNNNLKLFSVGAGTNATSIRLASGVGEDFIFTSNGGNQAHNNMPPYLATYFIIKAKQSAGLVATVVDNLDSESTTDALSAKQGRILNEKIQKEHTYSTEEQRIGTWINNKPIYRKVLTGTCENNSEQTIYNIENVSSIVRIEGVFIRTTDNLTSQIGAYLNNDANNASRVFYHGGSKSIIISKGSVWRTGFNYRVIIEYTKTTD